MDENKDYMNKYEKSTEIQEKLKLKTSTHGSVWISGNK
jgi:hypothetical protein